MLQVPSPPPAKIQVDRTSRESLTTAYALVHRSKKKQNRIHPERLVSGFAALATVLSALLLLQFRHLEATVGCHTPSVHLTQQAETREMIRFYSRYRNWKTFAWLQKLCTLRSLIPNMYIYIYLSLSLSLYINTIFIYIFQRKDDLYPTRQPATCSRIVPVASYTCLCKPSNSPKCCGPSVVLLAFDRSTAGVSQPHH